MTKESVTTETLFDLKVRLTTAKQSDPEDRALQEGTGSLQAGEDLGSKVVQACRV